MTARVSILVASYRRSEGLARLLRSIGELSPHSPPHATVVVDNDPAGSARTTVEASDLDVAYVSDPEPNIARARNRALESVTTEFVAFIDDDEVASSDWLVHLFEALTRHKADGVFGPTIASFDPPAPPWMTDLGFHGNEVPPTGTPLQWYETRTGNALLRREAFGECRFDERFGRTGGEDVELFSRLLRRGAQFVSCAEGSVIETIPSERARWRWMARRAFRNGQTIERIRRHAPDLDGPSVRGPRALWKASTSLVRAAVQLPRSRAEAAREGIRSMEYAGIAAAGFGFRMEEYG